MEIGAGEEPQLNEIPFYAFVLKPERFREHSHQVLCLFGVFLLFLLFLPQLIWMI